MTEAPETPDAPALRAAVLAFAAEPAPDRFDGLADRVARAQAATGSPYTRLCRARGWDGRSWRGAPLVPTEIFRLVRFTEATPAATFMTSGTTVETATGRAWGADGRIPPGAAALGLHDPPAPRGRGMVPIPDLSFYEAAMAAPFIAHVLDGDPRPRPWVSLIPSAAVLTTSSLSFMTTRLAEGLASAVTWAMGAEGLDVDAAVSALASHDGPVLIMTTAFALVELLDAMGRSIAVPPRSRMMLTGGFKGRTRALDEAALLALVEARLGIGPADVVPEYGMTELGSQAYGRPFTANPTLRLRVVDAATHAELPRGEPGVVAAFDLLNLDHVSAVLTGDLGVLDARGRLTLLGRAPDAPPRGCSLSAEALIVGVP